MFFGSQPDPGFYLSALYVNYDPDTLRNADGDKIPTQGELGFDAVAQMLREKVKGAFPAAQKTVVEAVPAVAGSLPRGIPQSE